MASRKRSEPNFGRKPSVAGKLPVSEPASLKKFVVILLMHVCKKVLLIDPSIKAGVYLGGVTLGSLISDLVPPPRTYFANKNNALNVYLVKLGWGWTFCLLAVFIGLTSYVYCCGNQKLTRRHLSRLFIGTIYWYCCTNFFNYVEEATGFCGSSSAEHYSKRLCRKAGHEWIGFDISGHTFLLMHCLLMLSEEVRAFISWERIPEVIQAEEEHHMYRMTGEQLSELKRLYPKLTPYIRGLVVAMALMTIIWELMLFTTILYFHNMPQKVLGALFAAGGWFFTYQRWYKMVGVWSPGMPGQGLFKYRKE